MFALSALIRHRFCRLLPCLSLLAPLWWPVSSQASKGEPLIIPWKCAEATDVWVRATVSGQRATGAFMQLKNALPNNAPVKLVGVRSPVAGVAEIHEMKMEGDVMQMRPVAALDLPAELKPGGYHIMLMELKKPLQAGQPIPLVLEFSAGRKCDTLETTAVVRNLNAAGPKRDHAGHDHKH